MEQVLCTPGEAVHAFAQERPEEVVVICAREDGGVDELTRAQLDSWTNRLAHKLIAKGVGPGDFVAVILPTCVEHIVATLAIYKAGGSPMPVSYSMPPEERNGLLALASPKCLFSDQDDLDAISRADMEMLDAFPDEMPDCRIPNPVKALGSGGSTGKPKLIVTPGPFQFPVGDHPTAKLLRFEASDLKYSPGPLYHNGPFFFTHIMLFQGGRVMLNERFQVGRMLDLIEQHRPTVLNLVPTMMQRMLREPDIKARDLSSVRYIWHLAAPCPEWAKREFIELLGPEKVLELWAATEGTGVTIIDGSEWLEHPGSVGRGIMTEFRIVDVDRNILPAGEVGEIFSRFADGTPGYEYLGAKPLEDIGEGFVSVGDLGYLDEEGYLYLSDRRTDMIISGGANIFPAEVEAVISSHPKVQDVAVVGLSDEDLGRRVHAIVEPRDQKDSPEISELEALCLKDLARYKVPREFELVAQLPRNEAGKIRRLALREERGG
jgi:bile acid-coenzyme A ligase